jgi:Flp pilus assembly protein TadD
VDEYAALTEKANENLAKAVPHLEKALEIKPDDAPTISALKETYARLKMVDKLEKLNQQ